MSIKSNIRKMLFIGFWCMISAGVLVLLVAAMRVKKDKSCSGYTIDIRSSGDHFFLDKKEVEDILTARGAYPLKGRAIRAFDLRSMEAEIRKNIWVSDAELFFDNAEVLRVRITERQPVARVFTSLGNSFYIDTAAVRLPLSDKFSARLPVFTGFPSNAEKLSKEDKELLKRVRLISEYIQKDSFWMAQVAQVDITPAREFEIIPSVGNHIIELGDGKDCDKAFRRLYVFYTKVISQTGFNYYERIKAQYAGQVVGVKSALPISRYDSLQAIRNVQKLIEMAQTEQERMMKLDSMNMMEHRTDAELSPAKLPDTLSLIPEKPPIQPADSNSKITSLQNPTLKSPRPYESKKKNTNQR